MNNSSENIQIACQDDGTTETTESTEQNVLCQKTSQGQSSDLQTSEDPEKQQQANEADGIVFTKWRTVCGFIVGLFVPFASMYVGDSIAIQAIYLENVMMGISTSQIGLLSSLLNFPSMVMTMVAAPFVDKLGPLVTGIFFNVWFLAMSIAMYFVWDKYTPLLVFRLLFGIMYEPSWLA